MGRWMHEAICGGINGSDAEMAAWWSALELEEAAAMLAPKYLALLDSQKYFDRFEWEVLWELMLAMGAPKALVVMLKEINAELYRIIKIDGHYGSW